MVFAPTGRIPSFEGWHRGLVSGSVAGRLNSPSLSIHGKSIAVQTNTVRRSSMDCAPKLGRLERKLQRILQLTVTVLTY